MTPVDKRYVIYAEKGVDIENGIVWDSNPRGFAYYNHATASGLSLMSYWYWDDAWARWFYQGTLIFRVQPASVVYLGKYDGESGIGYAFDKGVPVPRLLEGDQGVSFKPSMTIGGKTYALTFSLRLGAVGLSVSPDLQPSGQTLTNCLQSQNTESGPHAMAMNTYVACPGNGIIVQGNSSHDDLDTNILPYGDMSIAYRYKVTAWGTGTPAGDNDFFASSGIAEAQIEAVVEAMTLPTQILESSGTRVAVVPIKE